MENHKMKSAPEGANLKNQPKNITESQNMEVLNYIKRHGSITSWQAMNELKIMRLASRVADLRRKGYAIITILENKNNKSYGVYMFDFRKAGK